jgi:hypothetical protein
MAKVRNVLLNTAVVEAQFLRTELLAGLNFSKIAFDTKDELKIERNRVNARKAYNALLHFIPAAILSPEEAEEINLGITDLKAALRRLGEDV